MCILVLLLLVFPVAAQEIPSNEGPVLGKVTGHRDSPGALWKVLVNTEGRAQPRADAAVVRRFKAGTVVQANCYYGGSDEVLQNPKDARGQYWMACRTPAGEDLHCYIRANRAVIQPVAATKSPTRP